MEGHESIVDGGELDLYSHSYFAEGIDKRSITHPRNDLFGEKSPTEFAV